MVQILLFGFALSTEVKDTRIGVLDQDKSQASTELVSKIHANRYFDIEQDLKSIHEAEYAFKGGRIKMIMVIPWREEVEPDSEIILQERLQHEVSKILTQAGRKTK